MARNRAGRDERRQAPDAEAGMRPAPTARPARRAWRLPTDLGRSLRLLDDKQLDRLAKAVKRGNRPARTERPGRPPGCTRSAGRHVRPRNAGRTEIRRAGPRGVPDAGTGTSLVLAALGGRSPARGDRAGGAAPAGRLFAR